MARNVLIQTSFACGEIDPLARARLDLQQYKEGCEVGRNALFLPQGGFRWRPGTQYRMTIPSAALPESGVRFVPFVFSVDDSYMLMFTHGRMYVFRAGALVTNINGSGLDYLATGITAAQLADMNWTQGGDTLILVQQTLEPLRLVRGGSHASWTLTAIPFTTVPRHAFSVTNTPVAQTLTASAKSGNIVLTAGGGTPFTSAHIGDYVNMTPIGRARIVGINTTPSNEVSAIVDIELSATSYAANAWSIETDYEPVWSVARGWPRAAVFHEGRLYFGGSTSRPATVWGSKVGFPFDFNPGSGRADEAVENTISVGRYDAIVDMISGRDLQVFTTGGEYFVPQAQGEPITPEGFFFKSATANGARPGIRVQQLESGTLFVQRQGKAIQEFVYTDTELAYNANKVSLLSSHLLRAPSRMALRRATSTDEGDLLLVVNSADGTLGAWMMLRAQNVIAPSPWVTDGAFLDVGVDVTDIYCATRRTTGATTQYFVELFDLDLDTDCATAGAGVTSTLLFPFPGRVVDVILDGFYQGQFTVPASGTVTLPRPSVTDYEGGIPFTPEVTTMPAEPRIAAGSRAGFRKRLVQVNAMVKETTHLTVNGIEVPFRRFGDDLLDQPIDPFTGTKRIPAILGWRNEAQITFSRSVPLPATVLGADYRIAVYGGT
jgi:hypothetical protein